MCWESTSIRYLYLFFISIIIYWVSRETGRNEQVLVVKRFMHRLLRTVQRNESVPARSALIALVC